MAKNDSKKPRVSTGGAPWGWVLFTAWIGALVYFVQQSAGFWGFVLAVLKSAVWPAYLIHAVLKLLSI
jgi:hypothetical protein